MRDESDRQYVATEVAELFGDSPSVQWDDTGGGVMAYVVRFPDGGELVIGCDGVECPIHENGDDECPVGDFCPVWKASYSTPDGGGVPMAGSFDFLGVVHFAVRFAYDQHADDSCDHAVNNPNCPHYS